MLGTQALVSSEKKRKNKKKNISIARNLSMAKEPNMNQNPEPSETFDSIVRPEKWDDSQVGFRGSNASGGRIVLLPGALRAHGASKMALLGASLLPCILQCFRA